METQSSVRPAWLVVRALQTSYTADRGPTHAIVVQSCITDYHNDKQQRPSLEADSRAASQKIIRLVLSTKCPYHIRKRSPKDSTILSRAMSI